MHKLYVALLKTSGEASFILFCREAFSMKHELEQISTYFYIMVHTKEQEDHGDPVLC